MFHEYIVKQSEEICKSLLLIAENRADSLGKSCGRAISGIDGIFLHETIRNLLEHFNGLEQSDRNKLDLHVFIAYNNKQSVRFITDRSDQLQKATEFTADAQALSIGYPCTAVILRKIADDYRREEKRDRLYSEL